MAKQDIFMIGKALLKRIAITALKAMQADRLFRYLNRNKILVLAYHGVTSRKYDVQPWTMIPLDSFERQMRFLSEHYSVISLDDAVDAMKTGDALPKCPAVVTFDDGYANNYSVAFPVLRKYNIPATIFVTAGYVDTTKILPHDEAYFVITQARGREPVTLPEIGLGPLYFDSDDALLKSYYETMRIIKRFSQRDQKNYLRRLSQTLSAGEVDVSDELHEDFRLLSKLEIAALLDSGLIHIGAHTILHEILTSVRQEVSEQEIQQSKEILQRYTNGEVKYFAYPNGTERDYSDNHIACVKNAGYKCSVTTTSMLNTAHQDVYKIGRICIGPDHTAQKYYFSLRISGVI